MPHLSVDTSQSVITMLKENGSEEILVSAASYTIS
jgi:glutamine phosphoribosylpyrophosphate amidotransferase